MTWTGWTDGIVETLKPEKYIKKCFVWKRARIDQVEIAELAHADTVIGENIEWTKRRGRRLTTAGGRRNYWLSHLFFVYCVCVCVCLMLFDGGPSERVGRSMVSAHKVTMRRLAWELLTKAAYTGGNREIKRKRSSKGSSVWVQSVPWGERACV